MPRGVVLSWERDHCETVSWPWVCQRVSGRLWNGVTDTSSKGEPSNISWCENFKQFANNSLVGKGERIGEGRSDCSVELLRQLSTTTGGARSSKRVVGITFRHGMREIAVAQREG